MADEKASHYPPSGIQTDFRIEGVAALEAQEQLPRDLTLQAYAFDAGGRLLGVGDLDPKGAFAIPVRLAKPAPVEIVIGPAGDSDRIRQSAAYSQMYSARDWVGEGERFRLRPDLFIPRDIWWPWRPIRVCVAGRVRKLVERNGQQDTCPVAYVKVEVFDVDREACWWPFIERWWDHLLDRPVIHIPDLVKERPFVPPIPIPDPPPFASRSVRGLLEQPGTLVALNPQPLPPGPGETVAQRIRLNPQPEPPLPALRAQNVASLSLAPQGRVGEVRAIAPSLAERLEKLTLVSEVAPWLLFPRCFYSRQLVCETYTDCDGEFRCCFSWFPLHFRRGRLRFDARPDIIVRVTQVISGVPTVIYMDPYTSTRWNVTNAYLDLTLDNEAIVCGSGCEPGGLTGSGQAAVLQIGSDPVWTVHQADGLFEATESGQFMTNAAFGGALYLRGDFSSDLRTGAPKRYYKLSYAQGGTSNFTAISTPLWAKRAAPLGSFDDYLLGPQPPGSPLAGLYEVQDSAHWWLMPGAPGGSGTVLGIWNTTEFESDEGTYILRMEVYDETGAKIPSIQFPNHGGTGTGLDPSPVPLVTDHLDLKFHIDNRPMTYSLGTPATNACGVVPWSPSLTLAFDVHAEQPHGRVHSWYLQYTKGVDPTRHGLGSATYPNGVSPVNVAVNGNVMLQEPVTPTNPLGQLQSTCAFALILGAYLHVRGNWGFIYLGEQVYAIAVEKCPACPPLVLPG